MRGPIDYIIVNFNEARFDGKIISALQKAIESGAIQVLALSVIKKNGDGSVEALALDDESVIAVAISAAEANIVAQDDIDEIGSLLEPGSAAGLLVIEQLWAKGLKQALIDTGGELIAEGRIHPEAALELEKTLEEV